MTNPQQFIRDSAGCYRFPNLAIGDIGAENVLSWCRKFAAHLRDKDMVLVADGTELRVWGAPSDRDLDLLTKSAGRMIALLRLESLDRDRIKA